MTLWTSNFGSVLDLLIGADYMPFTYIDVNTVAVSTCNGFDLLCWSCFFHFHSLVMRWVVNNRLLKVRSHRYHYPSLRCIGNNRLYLKSDAKLCIWNPSMSIGIFILSHSTTNVAIVVYFYVAVIVHIFVELYTSWGSCIKSWISENGLIHIIQ